MTGALGRRLFVAALIVLISVSVPVLIAQARTKLRVTAEIANIRQKPDIGSGIVLQVPKDTILFALSHEGEWYLVSATAEDGRTVTGYVHVSLVMVAEPGALEEAPAAPQPGTPQSKLPQPPRMTPPPAAPVSVYSPATRFGLAIMGGGNYFLGGDLNTAAQGYADMIGNTLGITGTPAVSPVHIGYLFGGEFLVPLADRISLGFGLDYLKSQKESIVIYAKGSKRSAAITRPEMHAFPLRAFVMYSPLQGFYIKLGLQYYFAGISYSYHSESGLYTRDTTGTATANGLGVFGGFGLEWNIVSGLAFVIEATGRYAPLSGFSGQGSVVDSAGMDVEESGTLYYFEQMTLNGASFPQVVVRSKLPTEAGVANPREAEVDFSGFAIRAGFKVKF
jgi:hypothetical protein